MKDVKKVKGVKKSHGKESHALHDLHAPGVESPLLWTAIALCFGLGALLGWRQIASPDIGFHLSSARWILEHRAWPVTDAFSFTFPDHAYIDLQWFFQLLLYGANHVGGAALMMAMKIAVTLAFWGLLVVRARRASGTVPWSVPLLLMLVALGDYSEERPQVFSWLFGSMVLLILEEFGRGNRRWLPALPVIMLVWVNTHSLYVLGLVAIGVHAVWELRRGARTDRRLLTCAVLAGAACLINPYHVNALLLSLTQFTEIQSAQAFRSPVSGIVEFQSAFSPSLYFLAGRFVLFSAPLYWHLYSVAALVGIVVARKRVRPPDLMLWVLFAYIFAQAHKNFGYFVMVTFPLAAIGLDQAVLGLRGFGRRRGILWAQTALCSIVIVLVASGRLYSLGWEPRRTSASYNRDLLPIDAARFLDDHHIQGRILTTFNYGGYLHWITRLPVSIYGITEVVGPEFYAEYVESLTPAGFPAFLSRWKPTVAVVSFKDAPYWIYYLNRLPDWRLVQFTDSAAVYLHDSVTGPPRLGEPRPNVDYVVHTREQMKRSISDASNRPEMSLSAWLQGRDAFRQPQIRLATFFYYSGNLAASVNTGVDALAGSPIRVTEVMVILGNAFNALADYELSDLCFAAVLKSSPDPQTRQQIEEAVRARTRR